MNKNRTLKTALIIALVILLFSTAAVFLLKDRDNAGLPSDETDGSEYAGEADDSTGEQEYANEEEVLADFFSASTLHLKGRLESRSADGTENPPQKMEVWKQGSTLRIDYDIDGSNFRTLLVKDNTANFFYHGSKTKHVAVVSPDYYLEGFTAPSISNAEEVVDAATDEGAIYLLSLDKVYDVEGATNKYYIKEISYCVGMKGVVYIESVGNLLDDDNIPEEFNVSTMVFEEYNLNEELSDSVFSDPF